jgi:hypothetical protein
MVDGIENDTDRRDEPSTPSTPSTPARRPWHAPQFYLTEAASTYAQGATIPDAVVGNLT